MLLSSIFLVLHFSSGILTKKQTCIVKLKLLSGCRFVNPVYFPQHFLYFFPLPHGQGSLRPTFCFFGGSGGAGSKEAGRVAGETALRGRQLCEDFAPRNGDTSDSGEGGAKRPAGLPSKLRSAAGDCVKILLPGTEAQGLAGSGEQRGRPNCR